MKSILYYVHDPMCSWCWGFEPVRKQLFEVLAGRLEIRRLVGGLAPDSDVPMPLAMQTSLQQIWHKIEQVIPGTQFNFDFWSNCNPRRSTYPSNRAILAAKLQGQNFDGLMTLGIQHAYYLHAKNPSNEDVLIELAREIGLDVIQFEKDLNSETTQQLLMDEIKFTRSLGMNSFPSLALNNDGNMTPIPLDYIDPNIMLKAIEKTL